MYWGECEREEKKNIYKEIEKRHFLLQVHSSYKEWEERSTKIQMIARTFEMRRRKSLILNKVILKCKGYKKLLFRIIFCVLNFQKIAQVMAKLLIISKT